MERFEFQLQAAGPQFRNLIERIPLQAAPPLPPDWLRCEMLERHVVLGRASVRSGMTILEVGAGPHAIATVPLALAAGPKGRVVATERSRWGHFGEIVTQSGLGDRIRPIAGDARRLPVRSDTADLSVSLHAVRSLRGETETIRVLSEMFRVAPNVFLAESLPLARTDAQRAHLAMYDLREEVFAATTGRRDDLHYVPLDQLAAWVGRAGGTVLKKEILDVGLPHSLAYFPRSLIESMAAGDRREDLLKRWDRADVLRQRFGEDHPPVGILHASRA